MENGNTLNMPGGFASPRVVLTPLNCRLQLNNTPFGLLSDYRLWGPPTPHQALELCSLGEP